MATINPKTGRLENDTGGVLHHGHLRRAAAVWGATLDCESSGKWCVWYVGAPAGKLWSCADLRSLKVEWLAGDSNYRDEAVRDAIDRMAYGTHDETEPEPGRD